MIIAQKTRDQLATTELLQLYRRSELRTIARQLGERVGQNKADTIRNLIAAGCRLRVTVKVESTT